MWSYQSNSYVTINALILFTTVDDVKHIDTSFEINKGMNIRYLFVIRKLEILVLDQKLLLQIFSFDNKAERGDILIYF